MNPESMAQSLGMLRQVLDGTPYAEVARQTGVSRTLVEQRVKAIARDLAASAGLPGAAPGARVLIPELRRAREAMLEAIARARSASLTSTRSMRSPRLRRKPAAR